MEHGTKVKILTLAALCAGVVGVASYVWWFHGSPGTAVRDTSDPLFGWKYPADKFPPVSLSQYRFSFSQSDAQSSIREPGGLPRGLPVRLKIPAIGVDSAVEDALLTPEGRMDMPIGSVNVAWFSLGPPPGELGSAVIGGHFGISNSVPFVFENLNKLKVGDKVYIENDRGDTYAFIVRFIRLLDRNADATAVFTSGDGLAHLNLVTCEGIWNQVEGMYEERRVVFSDRIESEGPVLVAPPSLPIPSPILMPSRTPVPTQIPSPTPSPTPAPATDNTLIQSTQSFVQSPIGRIIASLLAVLIILVVYKLIVR